MTDPRPQINALMRGLISGHYQCFDAAAEILSLRYGGPPNKGHISKRLSGMYDWTVREIVALEDAAGRYPITEMLGCRNDAGPVVPGSLIQHAGIISKECGEAVQAILAAEQSSHTDDKAQAVKELCEAIVALEEARQALEASS